MSSIAPSSQSIQRNLLPPWLKGRWGIIGISLIFYTLVFIIWTQFHWGGEENVSLIGNLALLPPLFLSALFAWRVAAQELLDLRLRRAWLLLGLGTFSFFLGEVAWTYLENVLGIEPFPSVADVFFLGSYPLMLWGLLMLPGAPVNRRERLAFWLNLFILITTASMFVSYFLIIPTAAVNDTDFLTQFLATIYPICSLILLGGVLSLVVRLTATDTRAVLFLLFIGFGFFVASDLAFGYASLAGTYAAGSLIDAGWYLAQVFLVLAALRQLYRGPAIPVSQRWHSLQDRFLRMLPLIALGMGYGLVFYLVIVNFYDGALGMMAGALLLTALVIGQQIVSPTFANLPIRLKVILTFFLVSVLSVSLVSLTSYLTIYSNLQQTVGINLKDHAQDRAVAVSTLLAKQSEALEGFVLSNIIQEEAAIASAESGNIGMAEIQNVLGKRDRAWMDATDSDPVVQAVLNNEAAAELRKFRTHFTDYSDLLLTDKYGAVIAATSRPNNYDQSFLNWWKTAFHKGEGMIYMSQPIWDPRTNSRYMIIVIPVRDPFGSDLVGLLMATYSFKHIEQMLAAEDTGHRSEYGLLLPTGQMLTSSEDFLFLGKNTLDRLYNTATADYAVLSFNGDSHLVSQARVTASEEEEVAALDNLNWILIAQQDRDKTFAPLNNGWTNTLFITLTVLLLTTGLALILTKMLVAPISRLTTVARQIGEGNFSIKAPVESHDEIGVLAGTLNAMLDVLSRTQQELQESEAHYRNLVDYSPDMIAVERDGKYVFINPAGAQLLGAKNPHELIDQPVLNMYPRQDGEPALEKIEETQDLRGLISSLRPKMQRLDGTSFEAEIRAISISHAGEPAIQLVVRDITKRKQAEEKIRELLAQVARQRGELEIRVEERTAELNTLNQRLQEELAERQRLLKSLRDRERQLAQAVTLARIAYWELDLRTAEFMFNDQFYHVLRTTAHKVGGYSIPAERYLGQFVHPDDVDRLRERMQAAQNPTSNMGQLEYRCICGDGQVQHALLEYQIVFDRGHPSKIFGAHMDITERQHLVQSLRESKELAEAASRAKSEFLSRMSHELRTPMNAILGFAQLLEMSQKEPLSSNQKERIKQIVKGGQHLLDLINEILDISRIEANRLQISPEPVSVRDSIHEVVDLAVPLAVKRHIQIVTKLSRTEENAFVMADRQRFKQVLLNLLSNAVKYNYDGGSVILTCQQRPAKKWRISIADTGPGIPPEQMGRLFLPFERLVTDESSVEGTGLGLALAKRLVELMHGQVGVDSTPGSGSTFWIELPATESPVEHLQRMGGTGELPLMSSTSQTILYVEDNVANFELIREVFADYSQIELLWAADPKSGIESALQNRPNLILLDLHFGDRDGSEVLQQLKQNEATAGIPVVIVSADATPHQAERMTALGAHAYLTKPLNVKHFIRLMEELLGEKAV